MTTSQPCRVLDGSRLSHLSHLVTRLGRTCHSENTYRYCLCHTCHICHSSQKQASSIRERADQAKNIMFGQGKRPRRPYGHYIPSGKKRQGLLDARLYIPKQTKPRS